MVKGRLARARGFGLIEILVSFVVSTVGLLGLAGLLLKGQQAELEAYQRTQALMLVQDMVDRISANRRAAGCYGITLAGGEPYLGSAGLSNPTCNAWGTPQMQDRAEADLTQWDQMLKGLAQLEGGSPSGALIGARGCIRYDSANRRYSVTVAWQGLSETAPPADDCALGRYGQETRRRTLTLNGQIAELN